MGEQGELCVGPSASLWHGLVVNVARMLLFPLLG